MTKLADRLRHGLHLLGKYSLSSLTATGFDFATFSMGLALAFTAVQATVLGRSVGALVAFWLQRKWVFRHSQTTQGSYLLVRYFAGVLLGMGLNVGGVWLLHDLAGWAPWPARISSALSAWFLIFLFNRYLVFNLPANRQPLNYRT